MRFPAAALLLAALFCAPALLPAAEGPPPQSQPMTRLRIDSGMLYTRSGIPIHLSHANARIAPGLKSSGGTDKGDDKVVFLDSGQVGITNDSLTRLMQSKLQGKGVNDLKVTTDKGLVKISGKMKKLIEVPVSIEGPAVATADGKIELQTKSMKTAKLPIKGLADALGMNVSHVVGNNAKGVKSEGDTIIFDPDELWGLPVHGLVTRVIVQKNGLLLMFGAPSHSSKGRMIAGR